MITVSKLRKLAPELIITIAGRRAQRQGVLARQNFRDGVSPGCIKILLARLTRAQGGVQRIEDGCLPGIQRLGAFALFLKVDQNLVRIRGRDITDRNYREIGNSLLGHSVADRIDRRRGREPYVNDSTPFKINAIEESAMGQDGSQPGSEQQE